MKFYKNFLKFITFGFILFFINCEIVKAKSIRLASTTSTENSGLLKFLVPFFEKKTGFELKVIVAGTGQALRMAQDGNVDVILVHAPEAEKRFMEYGFGVNRRSVMYNDFIFVGPESDPAEIFGESDSLEVLKKIALKKQLFVSRGDDSGTHKKELFLWEKSKLTPEYSWYREVGQGMGRVLLMSDELNAYTITDRGTWMTMGSKLSLKLLSEGDSMLHNPYSIIAINPSRYPNVNYIGAMSLIAWITSVEGQKLINQFRVDGKILFLPTEINSFK